VSGVMAEWRERITAKHLAAVDAGLHDDECEFRPSGHFLCHCSKRRRIADGYTEPPGELIHQYPLCPRCLSEVSHDGDSFYCVHCVCTWSSGSSESAEFTDDYGDDLAQSVAQWDAKAEATQ